MAQQTIGIGSSANDGTGDPLRTAFDKVNDNFDELYSTGSAEVIVAGNDAPGPLALIANYVCDGINDEVQINQAAAEIESTGGRVRLVGTFNAEGIAIKQGVHFVGDNHSTRLNLTSGASESLFVLKAADNNGVFTGGGIHGCWLQGDNDLGVHAIDFSLLTSSLVEYQITNCYISDFDVGIRLARGGDRLPRIQECRVWDCEIGIYCGEHPQIADTEIRNCKLGISGVVNDIFIADCKIADCGVGICKMASNRESGYTATTLASSQIIATGEAFTTTLINGYVYFPVSGNFYRITAVPSGTELTVDGDPSLEGTKFHLISDGTTVALITGIFFFGNDVDAVLGNFSQLSNCFHGVSSIADGKHAIMIRGNDVNVRNIQTFFLGAYGYADGLISIKMTGASTTMLNPCITNCKLDNKGGYELLVFAGNGRSVDAMSFVGNHVTIKTGTPLINGNCAVRGSLFANNVFYVNSNLSGGIINIGSVGSSNSNACIGNMVKLNSTTIGGLIGGDWRWALIQTNMISGGNFTQTIVDSGANVTSAVVGNNQER